MRIIRLLFILFFTNFVYAQQYGVNTQSYFVNEAIDVEVDSAGNQFVAGYFSGQINFNSTTQIASSNGASDVYIAKYGVGGNLLWVQQFGGAFADKPSDLALDSLGNCYVTGSYSGQMTIGTFVLNSNTASKDFFIFKLSNSGTVIWALSEGGSSIEFTNGITCDNLGNVIVTGQYTGQSTIGSTVLNSMINPQSNLATYDFFIAKYSTNGLFDWVKVGYAPDDDRGLAVTTDSQNNIFVTGQFSDTLTFNGNTYNNIAQNAGFVTKLSPIGVTSYFNLMKAGMVVPYDIKINSIDEVVIIGDYLGTFNYLTTTINSITNIYAKKIFTLKTSNNGVFIWGNAVGSANEISARALAIDDLKNIYITGYFKCALSQYHDNQTAIYNSIGFKDGLFWKLNDSGITQGVKQFGGKENDEGQGIAILSNNSPVICGSYTENLFIPQNPSSNYTYTSQYGLQNSYPNNYLNGDASRNSFLTNAINEGIMNINYFNGNPQDSLFGLIYPNLDSIHFCNPVYIYYSTNTNTFYGPEYNFLWNTGVTSFDLVIGQTNNYNILVQRKDFCTSGVDSIVGILHNYPVMPSKNDNLGIAVNDFPGYLNYELCYPDSVQIWFDNICPACTLTVNGVLTDTIPNYYSNSGNYAVSVNNGFCTSTEYFNITINQIESPVPIQPYMYFPGDVDQNDTIELCLGNPISINIYNFLSNPLPILNQYDTNLIVQNIIYLAPNNSIQLNSYNTPFYPSQTGWQVFDCHLTIGTDNNCGVDTLKYIIKDSLYIIVNTVPNPSIVINGQSIMCPGSTQYLSATPLLNGFNWVGSPFVSQNANHDSIQINAPGIYYYSGTLIDTITGCSGSASAGIQVYFKTPPTISGSPSDGVICPNDTIVLTLPGSYVSYSWEGPYGVINTTSNTHIDSVMGFYYCMVMDADSCVLTTSQFEVNEFSTPSLFVDPYVSLCAGQSTTVTILYDGNPSILWTSPISSNSAVLNINQPATYICEIQQCGLTFIDSVTIIDGDFSIQINATDTILCLNENSILSVPAGYTEYNWSSGENGVNSIQTSIAGDFYVNVTNQYGCEVTSNTLSIQIPLGVYSPVIQGDTICEGGSIELNAPLGIPVSWYNQDTVLISTDTLFSFNQLENDTLFLAAYQQPYCPMAYQSIFIDVINQIDPAMLINDSVFCYGAQINYDHNSDTINTIQWYVNGVFQSLNDLNYQANSPNLPVVISSVVTNSCFYDSINFTVFTNSLTNFSFTNDSLIVCPQNDYMLDFSMLYDSVFWEYPNGLIDTVSSINFNNTIGNGYLYASAIDSNGCNTSIDSLYLLPSYSSVSIILNVLSNCFEEQAQVSFAPNYNAFDWQLPFSDTISTPTFSFIQNEETNGEFVISVIDNLNCTVNDTIQVNALEIPLFQLSTDTLLCIGSFLEIPELPIGSTYSWENFGSISQVPIVSDGWLTLTVTGLNGCIYYDSINIDAANCYDDLPNVFTPNGDGVNDYFVIDEALLFPNSRLEIINRWGQEVYSMNGYNNTFNGNELHDGVYFYVFYYDTTIDNSNKKEGFLTLIH